MSGPAGASSQMNVASDGSLALQRAVSSDGRGGSVGCLVSAAQQRVERRHVAGVAAGSSDAAIGHVWHDDGAQVGSGANFRPAVKKDFL